MSEATKRERQLPARFLSDGRRKRIMLIAAAVLLLAASAAAPFMYRWKQEEMRRYSGAEVNQGVKLLYDVDTLGQFRVSDTFLDEDGTYREAISGSYGSEIRMWRDFERPKLPCREAAEEKYPALADYSGEGVPKGVIYSARYGFTTKGEDGKALCHTFVIARRGGWDYFVDISAPEWEKDSASEYIDGILDNMYFLS